MKGYDVISNLTRREFIKTASLAALAIAVPAEVFAADKTKADLVVYGKIFTSEGNRIVEAFAVKDSKFIYVGEKKGAQAFIEKGKTEVIDYTGKGLVMPACGNGHAHYSIGHGIPKVGTMVEREITPEKFLAEVVPATVKKAKENGAKAIFGFGWDFMRFKNNMPTRQDLDKICNDIPMYFADEEGHKGLANTLCLVNAGIMAKDGSVLKKEVRGGKIGVDKNGIPNGFLAEQAGTYTRSFLDNDNLFSVDLAKTTLLDIEQHLLSEGYTMYIDGWGNYFYNENYYKAAQQMDKAGDMSFILGLPYEFESWMDADEACKFAVDVQKYASPHLKTNWVKLFMDGTVESGTGFVDPPYPDGHQGIVNWTEEEVTEITNWANAQGLSMHVHTMGNMAVNRALNAFVNGGKDEMRNTLVHLHQVIPEDYKRIADNNLYVVSGMQWHHLSDEEQAEMPELVPAGMGDKAYPMKSFFDNGINVSSHTDFPALNGGTDDPFGVMEIAVTGQCYLETGKPWWTQELITREQAINALTIAVAKQMFLENERGSIKPGKYADFLLVTKDVLTCPVTEIHTAKPAATYFEGKKVFSM